MSRPFAIGALPAENLELRAAQIAGKLRHASRKDLVYLSETLGLAHEGQSDEALRQSLVRTMQRAPAAVD